MDVSLLRSGLFHGNRAGLAGMLHDLQDLSVLANALRTNLTIVSLAAEASKDLELEHVAKETGEQVDREINWICTHIKSATPQVLIVPPDVPSEAKGSLPKQPTTAAFPDQIWVPLVGGVLALIVGLAGLLVGRVWLFPSLGPTVYLQAETPAHPSVRFYNVVVGHLVGLLAGFAGVFIFAAYNDPVTLQSHTITLARLAASVVAIVLTLLVLALLKANHPPAGATTLLVALG